MEEKHLQTEIAVFQVYFKFSRTLYVLLLLIQEKQTSESLDDAASADIRTQRARAKQETSLLQKSCFVNNKKTG